METVGKILAFAGKLIVFGLLSIIFIPAFLIVTYLQKLWSELLGGLFNL